MPKRRKILFSLIGLAGIFLCVLVILLVVTPRLINLESVKKEIQDRFAADMGAQIEYRRVNLGFFPRPHVVISQLQFAMPQNVNGTVARLKIYPKILPLFTGQIEIDAVHSRAAEITVRLPATPMDKNISAAPFSFETLAEQLSTAISAIPTFKIPSMVVRVSNSRIDFVKGRKRILGLHNVNARTRRKGNRIEFTAKCQSNLWESIAIKGEYEASGFKLSSQITINQLRPHAVADYFFPKSALKMTNARADLTLDLQIDGPDHLQAVASGSIPYMYWHRSNKDLKITDTRFQCEFQLNGRAISLSLTKLDLQDPRLSLAGRLNLNPEPPGIQIDLEGGQIKVATIQKIATALTEKSETLSDIFEILRAGDIQRINVGARVSNWAQLADEKNYVIRGSLAGGKIYIPEVSLHLENVRGDATIENGILRGENAEAQMGNSFGKKGKVVIPLTEN
ncbi:MAG: AsmA family protein [Deltaproteobacteria bacterium]